MSIASLDDAEGWPGAGASTSSFGGRDAPGASVVEETAGASYARRVRKSVIDALDVVQGFEVDAALDESSGAPDEHGERGALLQMLERREAGDVSTGVEFQRLAPHLADLPAGEQTRMLTHLCQTLPPSLADQTHVESFCRDAFAGDPLSVVTRGVELLGDHACTFYNQLHAMVSSLPPEHSLTLLRSFFREIMHTVKGLLFVSTTCGERLDALRWRLEDAEAECARGREKADALEAELARCRADCARLAADADGRDEQGGGGKAASATTAAPELRCVVMAQVQEARFLRRVCAGPYAEALALAERALDVLALKNGGVRVNHDPASAASTDQYCFAFPRPEHALWFAAEAQQRLLLLEYPPELLLYSCCAAEEASEAYRRDVVWRGPRLRFAAHYGRFLPEMRGSGGGGGGGGGGGSDVLWYSGAAMRRCARLLEGARGGDVLASTRAKRAYDEAASAAAAAHAEEASAAPGAWDAEARRRHAGLVLACVPDPPKPHKKGDVWRVYDKLLEGRYCDGDKEEQAEEGEEGGGVAASTMSSMALSSTGTATLADTFSSRGGDLSQLFDRVRIGTTREDGEDDDDEDSPGGDGVGAGDAGGAGGAASPGVSGESEQLLATVVKLQAATELGDQLVQHVASLTASQAALRSSLEASERHAMAAHDVAGSGGGCGGGGGVAVSATASRGSLGPRGSSPSSLARSEGPSGSSRRLPHGGGSELKKTPSQRRSSTTTAGAVAAAAAAAAAASRQPLYPYPSGGQRAAAGAVLKYLRGGELSEEEERALAVVGTMPDVPKTTSFVARKVQRRWGTGFDSAGVGQGGAGADTSLCKVHAAVCELFRLLNGFVSSADGGRSPDAMLAMLLRTISGNRIERKAAPKAYTKLAVDHAELMGGAAPAASAVVSSVMGFVVKIFVLVRDSRKRRGSSPGSGGGGGIDFVDAFPIPAKGHGLPALQSRKRNTLTVFSVPGIENRQKLLREKWGARRAGSIVLASDLPAASTASRRRSSEASEPRGGSRSGARASVQSAQGHVRAPREEKEGSGEVEEEEEGRGGEGRGGGGGVGASALTPPPREKPVVGTPTSPSPRGRLAPIQKE